MSSSSRLELVPHVTDSFPMAAHSVPPSDFVVAAHNSKGSSTTSTLNKALKKSISTIGHRVTSARSSFSALGEIITDKALKIRSYPGHSDSDVSSLLEEWRDINQAFINVDQLSREIAVKGASMIDEFIVFVVPYLCDGRDIGRKKTELQTYRKHLQAEKCVAHSFANDLRKISERVVNFNCKWGAHSAKVVQQLQSEIEKLQCDMAAIEQSFDEKQVNLKSVFTQNQYGKAKPRSGADIKRLRGIAKEAKQVSKRQRKTERKVSEHTLKIRGETDNLISVWNLIYDNIGVIESQMCFTEDSKLEEVFKKRVSRLSDQYRQLEVSLESLGVAMASSCVDLPKSNTSGGIFRRLLGFS